MSSKPPTSITTTMTAATATLLLLSLAASPAYCLPNPKPSPHPIGIVDEIRSADNNTPRASDLHMSNGQVIGLSLGIFVGVLLLCCVGGACETLLCTKRSRKEPAALPTDDAADTLKPTNTANTTTSSSSKDGALSEKKDVSDNDGQRCLNLPPWKKYTGDSQRGRFSWQADKELSDSNSVSSPGEPSKRVLRVVNVDGYETSAQMSSYNAQAIRGARSPLGGLPLVSPQFLIGDEEDEADYERDEMALKHAAVSAGPPITGPAAAVDHRTRAGAAEFENVPVSPLSPCSSSPTAVWPDGSGRTTPVYKKGGGSRQSSWKTHNKKESTSTIVADDDDDWSSTYSQEELEEQDYLSQHHQQQHQEHGQRPAAGRKITHVFPWMDSAASMPRPGTNQTSSSEQTPPALTHPSMMGANRI